MDRQKALLLVTAFAAVACLVFVVVAVEEVTYASDHPYAYGPAKIIAWAGAAGALLSVAVALLAYTLKRGAEGGP